MKTAAAATIGALTIVLLLQAPDKYSRKDFKHWTDEDKDCMNTRHEVLAEENIGKLELSENGCKVIGGLWFSRYDGRIEDNPRNLDVDHVVALKEAYEAGGKHWDSERKSKYANYLKDKRHLIAVSASSNRRKGAKGPHKWMPLDERYHCEYLQHRLQIKYDWGLWFEAAEVKAIIEGLERCGES